MSSEATMIKLVANDGISFRVEKAVAFKSKLIKEMWQNLNCTDDIEIHVHNANARTLRKVMEYCRKYQNEAFEPNRFREGQRIHLTKDVKLYLNMQPSLLIQIFSAAHYLNIPGLVAITKQKLDDIIIEQTAFDTNNLSKKEIQKKWESKNSTMSSEATMIKLVANDGISFRVEKAVAFKSKLIKEMWQNLNCTDDIEIHVRNANARTLRKVMEYCRKYQNEAFEPNKFREGQRIHLTKDVKMYLNMHTSLLIQIFSVAHDLNIPGLVAITKQMLDDIIIEQTALDVVGDIDVDEQADQEGDTEEVEMVI